MYHSSGSSARGTSSTSTKPTTGGQLETNSSLMNTVYSKFTNVFRGGAIHTLENLEVPPVAESSSKKRIKCDAYEQDDDRDEDDEDDDPDEDDDDPDGDDNAKIYIKAEPVPITRSKKKASK